MFTDPQSVTISGAAKSLPRIAVGNRSAVYESQDGALTLTVSHTNNKRTRSVVRFDRKLVGPDALNPATNKQYNSAVYMVVDTPFTGIDDATVKADITGFLAYLGTAGLIDKLLGQES